LQPTPASFDPLVESKPPTEPPSSSPTFNPTAHPTASPTLDPTASPTHKPTSYAPTTSPSFEPTAHPTTPKPTEYPTLAPTGNANFTLGDILILVGVIGVIVIGIILYLTFAAAPAVKDPETTPLMNNNNI